MLLNVFCDPSLIRNEDSSGTDGSNFHDEDLKSRKHSSVPVFLPCSHEQPKLRTLQF